MVLQKYVLQKLWLLYLNLVTYCLGLWFNCAVTQNKVLQGFHKRCSEDSQLTSSLTGRASIFRMYYETEDYMWPMVCYLRIVWASAIRQALQLGPEQTELLPNNDNLIDYCQTVIKWHRNPRNWQKIDGLVFTGVSILCCNIDNNVIHVLVCKLQKIQEVLSLWPTVGQDHPVQPLYQMQ